MNGSLHRGTMFQESYNSDKKFSKNVRLPETDAFTGGGYIESTDKWA